MATCNLEDNRKIAAELQKLHQLLEKAPILEKVIGTFYKTSNKILSDRGLKNLIITTDSPYDPNIMDVVERVETESLPAGVFKIQEVLSYPIVTAADNSTIPMLKTDEQKSDFRGKVKVLVGKGEVTFASTTAQEIFVNSSDAVKKAITDSKLAGTSEEDLKRLMRDLIKKDPQNNSRALDIYHMQLALMDQAKGKAQTAKEKAMLDYSMDIENRPAHLRYKTNELEQFAEKTIEKYKAGESLNTDEEKFIQKYAQYENPELTKIRHEVLSFLRDVGFSQQKLEKMQTMMDFYILTTPSAFVASRLFDDYHAMKNSGMLDQHREVITSYLEKVQEKLADTFKVSFSTEGNPATFDEQLYDMDRVQDPSKPKGYDSIQILKPAIFNADGSLALPGKAVRTRPFETKEIKPDTSSDVTVEDSLQSSYRTENTLLKQCLNSGDVMNYMWINKSFDGETRDVAEHHRLKMLASDPKTPTTFRLKRGNVLGVENETEHRIRDKKAVLKANDFHDILYIEAEIMESGKKKTFLYSIFPLSGTLKNFSDFSLAVEDQPKMTKVIQGFEALRNMVPEQGVDITKVLKPSSNKQVTKGRIVTRQKSDGTSTVGNLASLFDKHRSKEHARIKFHPEVFVLTTEVGKYKPGQAVMFASQNPNYDFTAFVNTLKKGTRDGIPSDILIIPMDNKRWNLFDLLDFAETHKLGKEDSLFLFGSRQTARFFETLNRVKTDYKDHADVVELVDQILKAKPNGKNLWRKSKGMVGADSYELITYLTALNNDPRTSAALMNLWQLMQYKTGEFQVKEETTATWGFPHGVMGSVPMVKNSKSSTGATGIDVSVATPVQAKGLSVFDFVTTTIDFIGSPSLIITKNAFAEIAAQVNKEAKSAEEQIKQQELSEKTIKLVLSELSTVYYSVKDDIEKQLQTAQDYHNRLTTLLQKDLAYVRDADVRKVLEEKLTQKMKEVATTLLNLQENMNRLKSGGGQDPQLKQQLDAVVSEINSYLNDFHSSQQAYANQEAMIALIQKVKNNTRKTEEDLQVEDEVVNHYGDAFLDLLVKLEDLSRSVC